MKILILVLMAGCASGQWSQHDLDSLGNTFEGINQRAHERRSDGVYIYGNSNNRTECETKWNQFTGSYQTVCE